METTDPVDALDPKKEADDSNDITIVESPPQVLLPPPREGTTRKAQLSLAQKRLVVQIQFVENARKKIMDESHPDMQSRLRKFERERDVLLEHAQLHEEYLRHTTAVIFAYECDEATSEFEMSCEKLRQDMLEEIHHEMEIINDQRKGAAASGERESLCISSILLMCCSTYISGNCVCVHLTLWLCLALKYVARKTTRKTRSTRTKNGEKEPLSSGGSGAGGGAGASSSNASSFALDTAQKIKKRVGNVFQPLEKRLAQSEVDFDLRELNGVFESSKKRRMEVAGAFLIPNELAGWLIRLIPTN